ncbi:hypothetical protein UB46_12895 [Burkholderiaceae bacterium 16]|nr:hypothetical protein UB46_12895 [Burkholderiaceae bacterium 16]
MAAEIGLPELLHIDPMLCEHPVKVTDARVWAQEVVHTLLEEEQDGSTHITMMFGAKSESSDARRIWP